MLASEFAFFRGAAYVMAADLARCPHTGLVVQLCGDAHLANFGGFAAPDRQLVFSVNDFDETHPGPFEWDMKRLVASLAVAGRELGFGTRQRSSIILAAGRAYREAMREFAGMRAFDLWYVRLDARMLATHFGQNVRGQTRKRFERSVAMAHGKDSLRAFAKLTQIVDGEPRIVHDPPLIVPIEELASEAQADRLDDALAAALGSYRQSLAGDRQFLFSRFRYVHAARKVVGVGSVGTRAWIVLLLGRDRGDPLFLQFKEAEASVLESFVGESEFPHHGQRVVEGQRLMQAASDIMLGWERNQELDGVERDYYVRQLWDQKASAEIEFMDPRTMSTYAEMCAWTLARAHARSGDATAIATYLGGGVAFDRALASFAETYADQNKRDYDALAEAVRAGRIQAHLGL
jgi:uncharacterized protein (DUF2252 family)